jgi:hypothetical protein
MPSLINLGHNIGDFIFAGKHLLLLPGPLAELGLSAMAPMLIAMVIASKLILPIN